MIDEFEAARDEFIERISEEAIENFSGDRLQSFYRRHPNVIRPALNAILEARQLQAAGHHAAALVFFVTAIELLLKACVLRPVVYGLVHHEGLAEVIVKQALGQAGFDRYQALLAELFMSLADIDIRTVHRDGSDDSLLAEASHLQRKRNEVIHQGATCEAADAGRGHLVALAVYEEIVKPMLLALGLAVEETGEIVPV